MKSFYLIGLIGTGIQASLTPTMHMQEAEALGFRYLYRLIDLTALGLTALGLGADALPDLLTAAERTGFNGLNVGVLNTVVLNDGKRFGHNTDPSRFAAAFRWFTGAAPDAERMLPDFKQLTVG